MFVTKRLLTAAALLTVVTANLRPQAPAATQPPTTQPAATAPLAVSPILGSWLFTLRNPGGSATDLFSTFSGDGAWRSIAVFRDSHGKVKTLAVWGTFKLTPAGPGTYQLVTATKDYAPRHRCVVDGACEPLSSLSGLNMTVLFPDPDHLTSPEHSALADRLQHLPIEAETPVPSVQMVTAAGDPSDAQPPVGLDDNRHRFQPRTCDDLQQARICNLKDGNLYTGKDGCKHCAQ